MTDLPKRPYCPQYGCDAYADWLRELARKALVCSAEWNEGEPCWCPLWWWDEQTGPTEGEHTDECDQKRALLDYIVARPGSEGE